LARPRANDARTETSKVTPKARAARCCSWSTTRRALRARGGESSIAPEWETASEIDKLGFNLYRAESQFGRHSKLDAALIAAWLPGSLEDALYTWVDSTAVAGITYYYWLEDVDIYGYGTLHGPVQARLTVEPTPVPPAKPGKGLGRDK